MSSPKSRLDQVIASVPKNATAARVVGRGEHYEPDIDYRGKWHSAVPPTMVVIDSLHIEARALAARVIGKRFGRLTVIGFAAPIPGYRARWVVRCSCGQYELRSSRFFKGGRRNSSGDWCIQCGHLQKIRYQYDTLGSRPVSEFAQPVSSPLAENRPAIEGAQHRTQAEVGGNPSRGDRKAANSGRPLAWAGYDKLGTLADVWPGARQ